MTETILEVEDLAKHYVVGKDTVRALAGVNLAVAPGESVAIVGESGSGKTTLAKLVLGVEQPSAGRIVFDGAELGARRDRGLRRRMQVVQQNPLSTLNPKRTIRQAIELPLRVHGMVPSGDYAQSVAELLGIVGLSPEYMNRYPTALSGGQRQRAALARALAARPDLIVLDEPTSALDVSVQARVLTLLFDLQTRFNLTYLFITHDLGVARNMASRIAVMYRGRIVESGPTGAVFREPRHRYTAMLLSSVPVVSEEEESLRPLWPWDRNLLEGQERTSEGCAFAPRCPLRARGLLGGGAGACRLRRRPSRGLPQPRRSSGRKRLTLLGGRRLQVGEGVGVVGAGVRLGDVALADVVMDCGGVALFRRAVAAAAAAR